MPRAGTPSRGASKSPTPKRASAKSVSHKKKVKIADKVEDNKTNDGSSTPMTPITSSGTPQNQSGIDDNSFGFDLGLLDTPGFSTPGTGTCSGSSNTGRDAGRRKSFSQRAQDGDFNKHASVLIALFLFFGIVLGPFLPTGPPPAGTSLSFSTRMSTVFGKVNPLNWVGRGNEEGTPARGGVGVGTGGGLESSGSGSGKETNSNAEHADSSTSNSSANSNSNSFNGSDSGLGFEFGERCSEYNTTSARITSMETRIQSLQQELLVAIESSAREKKHALELVDVQKELLARLTAEVTALSDKQRKVLDAVKVERQLPSLSVSVSAQGNIDSNGNTVYGDVNSSGVATAVDMHWNLFDSLRTDIAGITTRVQSLQDTAAVIEGFNTHATILNARSIEIGDMINTKESQCKVDIASVLSVARAKWLEEQQLQLQLTKTMTNADVHGEQKEQCITVATPVVECPVCPVVTECSCRKCDTSVDAKSTDTSTDRSSSNGSGSPSDKGDYVNLAMAREIIADVVHRTCSTRMEEISSENVKRTREIERSLLDAFQADRHLQETIETSRLVRLHNARKDYASFMSGAIIVTGANNTSETYVPPERDPVAISRRYMNSIGDSNSNSNSNVSTSISTRLGLTSLLAKSTQAIVSHDSFETVVRSLSDVMGVDHGVGNPEDVLSPDMTLGSCWPMKGSSGMITIKLNGLVSVTAVSIDHIPKNEALNINSAPKDFRVLGVGVEVRDATTASATASEVGAIDKDNEGYGNGERQEYTRGQEQGQGEASEGELSATQLLVQGTYTVSDGSLFSQTFPLMEKTQPLQYIRFEILSNHGNNDFTCIYRLRVHGEGNQQQVHMQGN